MDQVTQVTRCKEATIHLVCMVGKGLGLEGPQIDQEIESLKGQKDLEVKYTHGTLKRLSKVENTQRTQRLRLKRLLLSIAQNRNIQMRIVQALVFTEICLLLMITFMNKYDLYTVEFPIFLDLPAVVTLDVDFHDKHTLLKPFFD